MALTRYLLNDLLNDDFDPFYDERQLLRDLYRRPQISRTQNALHSLLRAAGEASERGISEISNQKDQFKVNLDVQHFKPDELNLKVLNDYLVVEGKHEEKQDKHGFISRQFTRRYKLPENVNLDGISSTVSSDGVLTIVAPKKVESIENGRQIPITQTNEPAIKQKVEPGTGSEKMES